MAASTAPSAVTAAVTASAPDRSSARVTVNCAAAPSTTAAASGAMLTTGATSVRVTVRSAVAALAPSLTCTVSSYTRSASASSGFS